MAFDLSDPHIIVRMNKSGATAQITSLNSFSLRQAGAALVACQSAVLA